MVLNMRMNRRLAGSLVVLLAGLLTVCGVIVAPGVVKAQAASHAAAQLPAIVKGMSLEEKVGQMFMPDFRQWDGKDVTEINEEIVQAIGQHHLGGVILFRENLVDTGQTARLVDQLQQAAGAIPLLIGVDQEGGVVNRLQSGTVMPGNMALGATRSTEASRRVGQAIGAELRALGINVNFAPVVDVNVNPDNPVIGVRSFGSDPQLVSEMGVAYIQGLHDAGVAASAKHFPGHGDTAVDSHLGLPSVPHDRARLDAVELKPFQAAIDAGVDLLMTAHVTFPAIDSSMVNSRLDNTPIYVPATLSAPVLTGLIRDELGFKGVVVTDCLQMKAITDHFGPEDAVIRAVQAGTDIILMPSDLSRAYQAVLAAVKNGVIPEAAVDQSVNRILALKLKLGVVEIKNGALQPGSDVSRPLEDKINTALGVVGCAQHRSLEQEIAGQAVTLLRNEGNILPFQLSNGDKVTLLAPWQDRLELMTQSLEQIIGDKSLRVDVQGFAYTDMAALNEEQKEAIDGADYVVLGSSSYNVDSRTPGKDWTPDYVLNAVEYCREQGKAVAVIAIRNPYDIMYLPEAPACICIYGRAEGPDIPAGMMAVFGKLNPAGKLPVAIPNTAGGELYPLGYGLNYRPGAGENLAGEPRVSVKLNGRPLPLEPVPLLENERFLVPLRLVLEAMGAKVTWYGDTGTAVACLPGTTLVVNAGSPYAGINGCEYPMEVAAGIDNERIIVPLEVIKKATGAQSEWDSATRSLALYKEDTSAGFPLPFLDLQRDVQSRLDQADRDLAAAAGELAQSGLDGDEARRILSGLASRYHYAVDCCTVDEHGKIVAVEPAAYHEFAGADISGQEHVGRLKETGRPVLSNVFTAVEGFAAVDMQRPVFSQQGELIGSVSMLISPERFFSSFTVPDMQGERPEMMIMQKDGDILYDTESSQTGRNTFTDPLYQDYAGLTELAKRVVADKAGVGTYAIPEQQLQKQAAKRSVWTTVGLHGTEWRLIVNYAADSNI